jgi:putative addiction module component (TIGR02574 family)
MDTATIEREALHLPALERARLAHSLLLSLENLSDDELSEAWLDEAERRAAEIDNGAVNLVSAEEVSAKARTLLR